MAVRRSIAFLMDMVIISIVITVFKNLLPVTIPIRDFEIFSRQFTIGLTLAPVFYSLYFIFFDVVKKGQTAGKLILGIFVVSKTGKTLTIRKHLFRTLYKMLSVLMFPVIALLFFLSGRYPLQDYYTDTVTIRSR